MSATAPGSMEGGVNPPAGKPQAVNHEGSGGGDGRRNYSAGGGEKRRQHQSNGPQQSRNSHRGEGGSG